MDKKKKYNGEYDMPFDQNIFYLIYRYEQYLDDARKSGIKKGFANGVTSGVTSLLLYCIYALGIVSKV